MTQDRDNTEHDDSGGDAPAASGRDKSQESTPTESGHSTADNQARRNQEDESPS
jgi:hypothetical protein